MFGAVALVAAQLTESTRAMYGITGVVIGAAYVLRAVGDVGNGVLSWLSPIGWGQAMHAFSGERWWPALISVAAVVLLAAAALVLFERRDFGSGSWLRDPGRRGLASTCGARSGWPGGSSAPRSAAGRPRCS